MTQLQADIAMQNELVKEALAKSNEAILPDARWPNKQSTRGVSIAPACRAFAIRQRCYRYAPLLADEKEEIEDWLTVKKIQTIAFSHLKRIKSERK